MNSTFKVVFNKARGALMVVNEVTSSVQGKGTKTVVAAAVAAMIAGVSGSAMATETDTEIKATDTALKATFTKAEKQDDVASSLIGTSGDKLVLKNVTNKGMYAAGSLDLTASSKDNVVTLKNGSVSNFSGKVTSADHFGAVVTATTGTLKIDNVTFENNKFDEVKTGEQKHNGARGIIRAAGANLEVAKSTFAGNEAVLGGAINVWSNGENTVKITDSTFTGNATKSHGGAVYITGSQVKTTIADATFSKNTSGKQGGALQLAGAGETRSQIPRSVKMLQAPSAVPSTQRTPRLSRRTSISKGIRPSNMAVLCSWTAILIPIRRPAASSLATVPRRTAAPFVFRMKPILTWPTLCLTATPLPTAVRLTPLMPATSSLSTRPLPTTRQAAGAVLCASTATT